MVFLLIGSRLTSHLAVSGSLNQLMIPSLQSLLSPGAVSQGSVLGPILFTLLIYNSFWIGAWSQKIPSNIICTLMTPMLYISFNDILSWMNLDQSINMGASMHQGRPLRRGRRGAVSTKGTYGNNRGSKLMLEISSAAPSVASYTYIEILLFTNLSFFYNSKWFISGCYIIETISTIQIHRQMTRQV